MKKNNVLIILLVCVIVLLGGFIIYDKALKKDNINESNCQYNDNVNKNISNSDINIDNLLSFIIFKTNSNGDIINYNSNNLTSQDINDMICNYILYNGKVNNEASIFELDSSVVDSVIKSLIDKKIDISKGLNIYSKIHTLTKEGNNYKISRKNDIPVSIPNVGSERFGEIKNITYKNTGEIIIDVDVQNFIDETPYYQIIGSVKLSFNVNNGIKFNSFDFTKAKEIHTYQCKVTN